MLKKIIVFLIVLSGLIFLFANLNDSRNFKNSSRQALLMDTVMQISINSKFDNDIFLDKAFFLLSSIDNLLSLYKDESEVSKLNSQSGVSGLKVDALTFEAIEQAKYFYDLTDGIFNPLIGAVTKLWKINVADNSITTQTELDKAISLSNINNLEMSRASQEIFLKSRGSVIDLGGIAKGFASQKVAEMLINEKIPSALINLGGNIYVIGNNPRNQPWKIGVQNPVLPHGKPALVLSVKDCAVITSGNYERFKIIDGKRYSHFFNPLNGQSVNSDLLSVTIVSKNGTLADALATAFMIAGYEKSLEIIKNIAQDCRAIFIRSQGDSIIAFVDKNLKDNIISSEIDVKYF